MHCHHNLSLFPYFTFRNQRFNSNEIRTTLLLRWRSYYATLVFGHSPSTVNFDKLRRWRKRPIMITQEMCPIRAEISTHKNLGKCIYLLFVWLAVIGFRQNIFSIIVYELIGVSFPPPRGIFANIPHLKEHYIRNILSHVSTLAVGAYRIFGVKREKLCKNHWK